MRLVSTYRTDIFESAVSQLVIQANAGASEKNLQFAFDLAPSKIVRNILYVDMPSPISFSPLFSRLDDISK